MRSRLRQWLSSNIFTLKRVLSSHFIEPPTPHPLYSPTLPPSLGPHGRHLFPFASPPPFPIPRRYISLRLGNKPQLLLLQTFHNVQGYLERAGDDILRREGQPLRQTYIRHAVALVEFDPHEGLIGGGVFHVMAYFVISMLENGL